MPLGIRRCLGAAFAALLCWTSAVAQTAHQPERWTPLADPVFQNFSQDQGLAPSIYNAIAEDGDGFLWFGGGKALYRWDGYRFHGYQPDPGNPHALQDSYILCLHRDSRGRLWIGTSAGGVARYDRDSDSFVTIGAGPDGLSNSSVDALADDGEDGLWVATEGGLDHIDRDGRIDHFHHREGEAASLPDDRVTRLWRDGGGRLWVGTRSGLARRDPGQAGFVTMDLPPPGGPHPTIWALSGDEGGRIWVGTLGQGAYRIEPGSGNFRIAPIAAVAGLSVGALVEGLAGEMWIGTYGQGIVRYDAATGETSSLRHDPTRPSSLADDQVHALYRDHMGAVWAGVTGAASRVDPGQDALLALFGGTAHPDGLSDSEVWSIQPTPDGRVWVGQRNLGVDILDPAQGRRVAALRPDPGHPETALPSAPVFAMAASEKTVYIGTLRGLYRADQASGKLTRLTVNAENPQMGVRTLAAIGRTLWIGCTGSGLWRFDLDQDKTVAHYGLEQLGDARVETVRPGADGLLWVGTQNGLAILDPASGKVERVLAVPANPDSLSARWVSALLVDSRGRQWVGTLGGGLDLADGRDAAGHPRFRRVGVEAGLSHSIIGGLFEDGAGHIWASSDEGLTVIDPDSLSARVLQRAEGAVLSIYRVGSGAVTPAGELMFGGMGGLIVARPDRVKPWTYQAPLVFSDLRAGGRPVRPGVAGRLELTPDENGFEAEFAALDFSAPERIRYEYRLDTVDKDWVPSDPSRRLAVYANLPPGAFTFHVRAANRDGHWSEKTLDLVLHVAPAWYQTLWFKLAIGLLACLGVAAIVASRTAYLRSRQKKLEGLIAERTASLADANAALARRTEQLEHKTRQVTDLLDNSGEGFFSFDATLLVGEQYSRACEEMLGFPPAGKPVDEVLLSNDRQKARTFRQIFTTALDASIPWKRSLMLSLLPSELDRGGRRLRVDYKDLGGSRFMVVLSDVTEERHLAHKVETEHRHLAMTVAAVTESRDFFDLIESFRRFWTIEMKELLASPAAPARLLQEVYRRIHTYRGSLSQFHFREAPAILHELETDLGNLRYRGDELMLDEISSLMAVVDDAALLDADLAPLMQVLGEDFFADGSQLRLSAKRASDMLATIQRLLKTEVPQGARADLRHLADDLHKITRVNLVDAIASLERVVLQTAKRMEKAAGPLVMTGDRDVWVEPKRYSGLLRALPHVFRNAVAHGIEAPEDRLHTGKPLEGTVTADLVHDGDFIRLTISDDGAGIDIEALRAKAVELGLHDAEQAKALPEKELIDLIFDDSVTTRPDATAVAGHGVGLAAVREEVTALGGHVVVRTRRGKGASFVFILPDDGVENS